MRVRMRAITVVFAIAMSAWLSIEAHAGGRAEVALNRPRQRSRARFTSSRRSRTGCTTPRPNSLMATGGNHPIIINDRDVMLIDDGTTPAAARALLEDMKLITDKPVRWVVNTHFHYDHTDGNSVFGPDVEIIGHELSAMPSADLDVLHREPLKTAFANMPIQIESLKNNWATQRIPRSGPPSRSSSRQHKRIWKSSRSSSQLRPPRRILRK